MRAVGRLGARRCALDLSTGDPMNGKVAKKLRQLQFQDNGTVVVRIDEDPSNLFTALVV